MTLRLLFTPIETPYNAASRVPRRKGRGSRPVCAAADRSDVTHRLQLEGESRRQRVLGMLAEGRPKTQAKAATPSVPTCVAGHAMPENLTDKCAVEWSHWAVAEAKLTLLRSEAAMDERFGAGAWVCHKTASRAIDQLRTFSMPPLLLRNSQRLQGSWVLVSSTQPKRFGTHLLGDFSRGLEQMHHGAPKDVDVQFVVRTFTAEQYCETTFFADLAAARSGSFSEVGRYEVEGANTLKLIPTHLMLTVGKDQCELRGESAQPHHPLTLSFLDDDLLVQGPHDAPSDTMLAWGRDHDVGLRP